MLQCVFLGKHLITILSLTVKHASVRVSLKCGLIIVLLKNSHPCWPQHYVIPPAFLAHITTILNAQVNITWKKFTDKVVSA